MSPELITILLGFTALVATQVANMLSINKQFDDVNKRFDDVLKQMTDLRERMARLDGLLSGRRDRDVASRAGGADRGSRRGRSGPRSPATAADVPKGCPA